MKAAIFSSAEISDYSYISDYCLSEYFIICADGGYVHAQRLGIIPNVIIGDNDSFKNEYPKEIKRYIYPPEKDKTDTNLAIDCAIENGADEILLFGGLGGRIDHEFSHFCLIKYALDRGVRLKLIDDINEIWMENKPFELRSGRKKYVSFFPYGGDVSGFNIKGLKYEAENMTLSTGEVQASSNEFAESDIAKISFDSGTLLVMLCDDRQ